MDRDARSHARAGGRRMRDIKFFNDFLVPFLSKLTKIRRILIIHYFNWNSTSLISYLHPS